MRERPEASEAAEAAAGPATDMRSQTPSARGSSITILRDTGRVEAFSDGVFAVAATLLVLNLQPPAEKSFTTLGVTDLLGALANDWRSYVVYVISFGFILIMWINHHNMFRVIRGTDHTFLLLNGLLLLLVTLVPFTTALIPHYDAPHNQSIAVAVYSANYFLIALAYNFMWWYASWHGRLLNAELDMAAVRGINRRYLLGPVSYLGCVALAFVSVPASLALNVALAIFYAWPYQARRT